jgi:hypothetical protein
MSEKATCRKKRHVGKSDMSEKATWDKMSHRFAAQSDVSAFVDTPNPCTRVSRSPCTRVSRRPCITETVYHGVRVPVYPCTRVPVYPCTLVPVYPCTRVSLLQWFTGSLHRWYACNPPRCPTIACTREPLVLGQVDGLGHGLPASLSQGAIRPSTSRACYSSRIRRLGGFP